MIKPELNICFASLMVIGFGTLAIFRGVASFRGAVAIGGVVSGVYFITTSLRYLNQRK